MQAIVGPCLAGCALCSELNADWRVCGEAVDGADAARKAQPLALDLIVMDFSMPEMNGGQAAREIVKSGADILILLCTLHLSPEIIESARNAWYAWGDFKNGKLFP